AHSSRKPQPYRLGKRRICATVNRESAGDSLHRRTAIRAQTQQSLGGIDCSLCFSKLDPASDLQIENEVSAHPRCPLLADGAWHRNWSAKFAESCLTPYTVLFHGWPLHTLASKHLRGLNLSPATLKSTVNTATPEFEKNTRRLVDLMTQIKNEETQIAEG